MEQDHQKKESLMENINIIDKNWKSLTKPKKLEIESNEDKSIAKVIAEPLEKGFGQTIGNSLKKNFVIFNSRCCSYCNSNRWCIT